MGANIHEKLQRSLEIIFVVLNFVAIRTQICDDVICFFRSQHEGRLVTEDPVDPGHCQRDTGTIRAIVKVDLAPNLLDFVQHK